MSLVTDIRSGGGWGVVMKGACLLVMWRDNVRETLLNLGQAVSLVTDIRGGVRVLS